jgi:N-dimethylarginine dimethylaminohydrolase
VGYTRVDVMPGALRSGVAIVFEPAIEAESLAKIRETYPELVSLMDKEQTNAGANVLSIDPQTIITIAENAEVKRNYRCVGLR